MALSYYLRLNIALLLTQHKERSKVKDTQYSALI